MAGLAVTRSRVAAVYALLFPVTQLGEVDGRWVTARFRRSTCFQPWSKSVTPRLLAVWAELVLSNTHRDSGPQFLPVYSLYFHKTPTGEVLMQR